MPKGNGPRGNPEKTGALPLMKAADPAKAAAPFHGLLADSATRPERRQDEGKPGPYEMVEYLPTTASAIGFALDSHIGCGGLVFTILKARVEYGVVIQDFIDALLGRVLEKHSRCDAETSNVGDDMVVALKLVCGA